MQQADLTQACPAQEAQAAVYPLSLPFQVRGSTPSTHLLFPPRDVLQEAATY